MIIKRTTEQGLTFLDLETPLCSASLCLQGAHLTSWKPKGQEECLFLSTKSVFSPGKAIRGGIPICWPWFGSKPGSPAHGLARTSEWHIHHQETDRDGNLLLSLAFYPEDFHLPAAILRLKLGSELSMKLETTVRRSPCVLTEAFHNYFAVSNLTKCRIFGLENIPYRDEATHPMKHGENPLAPLGCLDRVYSFSDQEGIVTLEDPGMKRKIVISRTKAHSVIVWNPGQPGASQMIDLDTSAWNKFLCVETGNAAPKGIHLAPGQSHTLSQHIAILPLED